MRWEQASKCKGKIKTGGDSANGISKGKLLGTRKQELQSINPMRKKNTLKGRGKLQKHAPRMMKPRVSTQEKKANKLIGQEEQASRYQRKLVFSKAFLWGGRSSTPRGAWKGGRVGESEIDQRAAEGFARGGALKGSGGYLMSFVCVQGFRTGRGRRSTNT